MTEPRKPIKCRFADGVFTPLGGYWQERMADYDEGEIVTLSENIERTGRSHNNYFAALSEAFKQLPEDIATDIPNVEFLRKYALIHTGHYIERNCVFSTELEARRMMKFMREGLDEYVLYSVTKNLLLERKALSQSMRAMGSKAEFEKSKSDVLAFCAELIGISVDALQVNAGKAA